MRLSCARLDEFTVGVDEQRALAIPAAIVSAPAFCANPGEQVGEGVVLVVCPFLERMVVAFCAVDGEAEEGLAHVFSHRFGVLMDGVKVCCALGQAVAFCGDYLTDNLVPRRIIGDARTEPRVVGFDGIRPEIGSVDEENVGEPVRPVVHELGALEEGFDEAAPLFGMFICEERLDFCSCGQGADCIDHGATQEGGVVARWGGRDAETLELSDHSAVDGVGYRVRVPSVGRQRILLWSDEASDDDPAGEPCGDGTCAVADDLDLSGGIVHFRDGFIRRRELRPAGDVTLGAVLVMSGHEQTQRVPFAEDCFVG